jgi:hypothetical protein
MPGPQEYRAAFGDGSRGGRRRARRERGSLVRTLLPTGLPDRRFELADRRYDHQGESCPRGQPASGWLSYRQERGQGDHGQAAQEYPQAQPASGRLPADSRGKRADQSQNLNDTKEEEHGGLFQGAHRHAIPQVRLGGHHPSSPVGCRWRAGGSPRQQFDRQKSDSHAN